MNRLLVIMKLLGSFSVIILISGWESNELSRSKAKEMIEAYLQKDPTIHTTIDIGRQEITGFGMDPTIWNRHQCVELIMSRYNNRANYCGPASEGFLSIQFVGHDPHRGGVSSGTYICNVQLTEKAQPYVLKTSGNQASIKIATLSSVEITGVTQPSDLFGNKVTGVDFTPKYDITPFGKALVDGHLVKSPDTANGKALFVLYDDGWRLDRASGLNNFIGLDRTSSIAEGNKECVLEKQENSAATEGKNRTSRYDQPIESYSYPVILERDVDITKMEPESLGRLQGGKRYVIATDGCVIYPFPKTTQFPAYERTFCADGTMPDTNEKWPASGTVPVPGQPYGGAVLFINGTPVFTGSEHELSPAKTIEVAIWTNRGYNTSNQPREGRLHVRIMEKK